MGCANASTSVAVAKITEVFRVRLLPQRLLLTQRLLSQIDCKKYSLPKITLGKSHLPQC